MAGALAVEWPDDVVEIVLESGRANVLRPGSAHTVELDLLRDAAASEAALPPGVVVRRPFHPIDGGTQLAIEDNNPLFLEEAHPDKSGNAVDLGGVPVTAWLASLRAAFAMVARYLPDVRDEMDVYLSQIVPVGAFADKHLSASYQEAIGTIYLSHHPHVMTMTEALIHEFQHNKINALFELDPVLENAFSPLFPSPVRPDPRPLHGVLLAIHAFVPVARLYEQMLAAEAPEAKHPSFRARFADIVAMNREGADVVLTHAKPTRVGSGVVDELRRWDRHYRCAV
jgi:HEXXH motif-containing protein